MVIGSGIMAERLSGGNVAIALLANTLATVGGLYVLIEVFGPVSGAHFNPAVSLVMALRGALPQALLAPYVVAQLVGAMLGAWLAHAMFDLTILQFSTKVRSGTGQWIAEAVATAGLLLVILRAPAAGSPAMVAATSARPTGSPPLLRSPTPRPRSAACSATALPASRRRACPASCWPSWSARPLVWGCTGCLNRDRNRQVIPTSSNRPAITADADISHRHARPLGLLPSIGKCWIE